MSFRFVSFLNSPPLVSGAGATIVLVAAGGCCGLPLMNVVGVLSVGALKLANVLAFATNVVAVSIPGRLDGTQDARMRAGDWNPNINRSKKDSDDEDGDKAATTCPLHSHSNKSSNNNNINILRSMRDRKSLVTPAGWAFAIWGPIYIGEAIFCAAQYFDASSSLAAVLPEITVHFVAANLMQSLWCASFRPSYFGCSPQQGGSSWHNYVSVFTLGGTAFSLSQLIPVFSTAATPCYYYLIPLMMHFGWTTAATLVNLNGSLAMNNNNLPETTSSSERTLIAVGHASSVVATALGVGVTLVYHLPVYGLTVAWALVACAKGLRINNKTTTTGEEGTPNSKSSSSDDDDDDDALTIGAKVQQRLLTVGALASAGSAIYTLFLV